MAKYTDEKNIQILISLLKQYGIKKIIISPGATNASFVGSVQSDDFFELYSCVDERSACYMACGLAEESGEPVAISCTGATASRNYIPGLTEAFYRKLPILAITSSQFHGNAGHNIPQMLDRTTPLKDIVTLSVQAPSIYSGDEEWYCTIELNKALQAVTQKENPGPVHINLETNFKGRFNASVLPKAKKISLFTQNDELPSLKPGKIGIFVGAHSLWTEAETKEVDDFCKKYDAVVICDQTSNYFGKYRIMPNLVCDQDNYNSELNQFNLIIHLGNISGAYMHIGAPKVWRVNPDGKIVDTFKRVENVFKMSERQFFNYYNQKNKQTTACPTYHKWEAEYEAISAKINPDQLPFSNIWTAHETINRVPENSVVHLGILNSLRSWNYFKNTKHFAGYSNTGGFGIDGIISTLIGASLKNPTKNYYCVLGDLAFFYDVNSLGNHVTRNNLRIMLVNNGGGTEFHNYSHSAQELGDDKVGKFVAADGHFGNKSSKFVKDFVTDLGYEYISATNKEEFLEKVDYFTSEKIYNKSVIFEVFTNSKDESNALKQIRSLKTSPKLKLKNNLKKTAKKVISPEIQKKVRNIIKK